VEPEADRAYQGPISQLRAAFAGQDMSVMEWLLHPDVEWVGAEPGPLDCHDRDQALSISRARYDAGVRGRPVNLRQSGDRVLLEIEVTGPDEHDHPGHRTMWQVGRLRDGKVIALHDDADAATAGWAVAGAS